MTAVAASVEAAPLVLREDRDGVCRLTLNRPNAYNAFSIDLMESLTGILREIDLDHAVKVVVIEGAGKGFCAGHDLKEMKANPDRAFRAKTFETCSTMMMTVTNLRQPVIAKVHGIATAAGCQLVATCDLAVAAETARFGTPGVNIGLFCSTPMVALSRAVHRKQAMEMLLTGDMIHADKAVEIGLINRAVAEHGLEDEVAALAAKIASKSGLVLKTGKEAFQRQIDMDLAEAYAYCAEVMTDNMSFDDAEEGIAAFIEKRKPVWKDS
ncbi:enoyl-CoA hydratase [Hwanghaeella sp.]|uniref:enoyl-CoA hydratase n=1 Tax=Hwanghaeella sp. TaxID=2605943 RepID=UPI003CCB96DF